MVVRSGVEECAAVSDVCRIASPSETPSGPDLERASADGGGAGVSIVACESESAGAILRDRAILRRSVDNKVSRADLCDGAGGAEVNCSVERLCATTLLAEMCVGVVPGKGARVGAIAVVHTDDNSAAAHRKGGAVSSERVHNDVVPGSINGAHNV